MLGSHYHRLNLINLSKMAVSGDQRTAGFHAAGSDPDVIDWDFGASFNQRQINNPVFAGNVMIDTNDLNLRLADEFLKFSFVETLTAAFHNTVT